MGNTLINYLNKRLIKNTTVAGNEKAPGPVITISREVGCSGLELAYALAERLNKTSYRDSWKVISKEILQQSAQELDLDPERISKIFKQMDRTSFDEILNAFNEKRFKSDKKIKKTVIEVIRSFGEDGFCIIVGRASNVICADISHSLHLRMVAPMDYRINSIMQKNGWSRADAEKFIARVEKERFAYRHAVMGKNSGDEEFFDITFNRAEFNASMIVDQVMLAICQKKILEGYATKIDFF